jgi:hypothetical protein
MVGRERTPLGDVSTSSIIKNRVILTTPGSETAEAEARLTGVMMFCATAVPNVIPLIEKIIVAPVWY